MYDLIVIGGGISGLNTVYQYLKKYKKQNKKVLLIEKNSRTGGRIYTHNHKEKNKKYQIEAGAGRISSNHKNLMKLIKEFDLKLYKIPNKTNYKPIPQNSFKELNQRFKTFDQVILEIHKKLKTKPKSFRDNIKNYTLSQLVDILFQNKKQTKKLTKKSTKSTKSKNNKKQSQKSTIDKTKLNSKFLDARYQYWSEVSVLNAEDALITFSKEFNLKVPYFVVIGGLTQLVEKMTTKIKEMSCSIKLNTPFESIQEIDNKNHNKNHKNTKTYLINQKFKCKNVVFAMPKYAYKPLFELKNSKQNQLNLLNPIKPYLKMLSCQPLYRVYAQYPKDKDSQQVWFHDIGKVTSNLEIKFIIPISNDDGTIMISYTDGKYADFWNRLRLKSDTKFKKELNRQLKLLFPDKNIPEPIWFTHHYWQHGACYWKPGFSGTKMEKEIVEPDKNHNIYFANSNFSRQQAWIEGGLVSSNLALKKIIK